MFPITYHLLMQLMDVVIAYLYGDLDTEIYIKVPEGLPLIGLNNSRGVYSMN